MLKAHSDVAIRIIGHSDRSVEPAADLALSETRARNVADALKAGGISARRIAVEARGGDQPIGDDRSPAGRARNERVSIVLTHKS
jgi:outer membrane protein OmpA-like peptidoglycan-associated protein